MWCVGHTEISVTPSPSVNAYLIVHTSPETVPISKDTIPKCLGGFDTHHLFEMPQRYTALATAIFTLKEAAIPHPVTMRLLCSRQVGTNIV